MSFREFTFCNADQVEIMVCISHNTGKILDMYCYANMQPVFYNSETGNELNTIVLEDRKNPLFVTIKNKPLTLKRMVLDGEYLPLLDTEDCDYEVDFILLVKCFEKHNIKPHINTLSY